ncbi:VWA domain-containing protein [Jannaschia rubra]|uniref:Flp pilus assembly protein TadG n=1 Tax=Jannaschia rubra TaxID=282197 RepID=A0A0M6XT67_9RHOB|nr:VWA domain-containing protein [Jannaschia rubra]CTQ33882.1 Flp pilus assembly protein TadG [Jannaschia rubra]SFG11594.1 Flp pilus assembly protein TadG [Jannaschia rubra]
MNRILVPSRPPAAAGAATAFGRREDGSLTIFGLFIFLMMLIAAGVALDIMRSEVARTELQYAIDRASLSAARLRDRQSLDAAGMAAPRDAQEIVRDYVRAAGLDDKSVFVTSRTSGSERLVTINSDARTNSLFMNLLGVDTLVQPVSSQAREVRTELELSLVLDISGSMGGSKIAALRDAASDFVGQLLKGREELSTISIVPYNDRVNAGSTVGHVFDMTREHDLSHCAVFENSDFNRLDLPRGSRLQRMGDFDFRTNYKQGNDRGLTPRPNCERGEYGAVLAWSNDIVELRSHIRGLGAGGWTAMDQGVKWGTLLLDPSSNDELSEMITSSDVPGNHRVDSVFVGRPVPYNTVGTHKVLVMMTDGDNTNQWGLKSWRRSGQSGIRVFRERPGDNDDSTKGGPLPRRTGSSTSNRFWKNDGYCLTRSDAGAGEPHDQSYSECRAQFDGDDDGTYRVRYSFWSPEKEKYYIPHLRTWWSQPYGGSNSVMLDWTDVHSALPLNYVVNDMLKGVDWDLRSHYFYSWEQTHDQARADDNLSRLCKKARDAGVVIYTIAFKAPLNGQKAMRDCAGPNNEARYYNIDDLNIAQAFDDVLASVTRLRLTQ